MANLLLNRSVVVDVKGKLKCDSRSCFLIRCKLRTGSELFICVLNLGRVSKIDNLSVFSVPKLAFCQHEKGLRDPGNAVKEYIFIFKKK